ncbi:MAG: hypothetical protein ACK4QP_14190, partial [Pseudorhizobium sp.]
ATARVTVPVELQPAAAAEIIIPVQTLNIQVLAADTSPSLWVKVRKRGGKSIREPACLPD